LRAALGMVELPPGMGNGLDPEAVAELKEGLLSAAGF